VRLIQAAFRGEIAEDEGLKILMFQNNPEDLFHANSIQVLPRDEPGLWRAGDLLISILVFDTIAVIDHESGRVIWTWGRGELQQPHHATLLPDGNILIFDNGVQRKYSRVVKVNPKTSEIVWRFQTDPPDAFYSETRGGAQELPNGNVLIAETNNGRAFEVTPAGKVVWEYYNEVLSEVDGGQQRGALYRFTRTAPSSIQPLMSP
jgi:outer membrane protein assembly factor BamB